MIVYYIIGFVVFLAIATALYLSYFYKPSKKGSGKKEMKSDTGLPIYLEKRGAFRLNGEYDQYADLVKVELYDYESGRHIEKKEINLKACKIFNPLGRRILVDLELGNDKVEELTDGLKKANKKVMELEDEIENMKARRNKEFNDYKDALKSETIKEIQKSYERKN